MNRRFYIKLPVLVLLLGLLLSPFAFAANRVALVIGNADYAEARLANPVKDARDISVKDTAGQP